MKRLIAWLERIPYDLLALVARAATAVVFWRSGQVKLDDWSATLGLFETEYRLPLLPPHLAAQLALGLELGGSVLVLLGLGTRLAALAFIGMVATIQLLVYPQAWPTHIQWLAFLLPLAARGPGRISLDAVLARWLRA
ncbi:MAG: DoxX family protein [Steroidobacteraceae bacterium]